MPFTYWPVGRPWSEHAFTYSCWAFEQYIMHGKKSTKQALSMKPLQLVARALLHTTVFLVIRLAPGMPMAC